MSDTDSVMYTSTQLAAALDALLDGSATALPATVRFEMSPGLDKDA